MGCHPQITQWMFDSYYGEESLGFAYAQIGQENSFLRKKDQVLEGLRVQIEQLKKRRDVTFQKMCDSGVWFKENYPITTPATSVVALNNFDTADVQSVYYDCKNYTANLFRFEDRIFFRSLFLFDERIEDLYLKETCTTFDAIYENLPIVDTMTCPNETRTRSGLTIDGATKPFGAEKIAEGVLAVGFENGAVTFYEDRIEIDAKSLWLDRKSVKADVTVEKNRLLFVYKNHIYCMEVGGATLSENGEGICFAATERTIVLRPRKG